MTEVAHMMEQQMKRVKSMVKGIRDIWMDLAIMESSMKIEEKVLESIKQEMELFTRANG